MSLLRTMSPSEYNKWIECNDWVPSVLSQIKTKEKVKTAEDMLKLLDKRGYTLKQLKKMAETVDEGPSMKVAVLVANYEYKQWRNLNTPPSDCLVLGEILKKLDFTVIFIQNCKTSQLKEAIATLLKEIPPQAYIFFYYAGHGFQLGGINYMLGVQAPFDDLSKDDGLTEDFIINEGFKTNSKLLILLLDMCRIQPEKCANPKLYEDISMNEVVSRRGNLIVGYATCPYMSAFEKNQECSNYGKNKRNSSDNVSLYVKYLSQRLGQNDDIHKILMSVNEDFDKNAGETTQNQKPQILTDGKQFYLKTKSKGSLECGSKIESTIKSLCNFSINISLL